MNRTHWEGQKPKATVWVRFLIRSKSGFVLVWIRKDDQRAGLPKGFHHFLLSMGFQVGCAGEDIIQKREGVGVMRETIYSILL